MKNHASDMTASSMFTTPALPFAKSWGARQETVVCLFAVATFVAMLGCGDGRPRRLAVSGQILIDGEPLSYGTVRFVPQGARASTGTLDEQGHFTLTCYGNEDGVVPGLHRVEVDAAESLSSTKNRWHAPKKYARYKTSGLTQEIVESTDSLVIALSWEGGKPFTETVH